MNITYLLAPTHSQRGGQNSKLQTIVNNKSSNKACLAQPFTITHIVVECIINH
jgi:hypothetical protein